LAFVLEVIEGADRGASVKVDPSKPSRVLIGSSPVCDLKLSDGRVSRRHAALELSAGLLRLTDLGSTNGTTVQGLSIADVFLNGGEVIRVGDTALSVRRTVAEQEAKVSTSMRFGKLIGGSFEMRRLYSLCERLAASNVPLVIEGETGTGKEVLAEALHECGPRASRPFVVFDCTAVAANLAESALFGHERGAFTGAMAPRKGVFELAESGTLLIDEIGDLELPLQAKLLRAIERGEVQRVGANRWLRTDVRVLAATRRNLDEEVHAGRFRDDLFFRLAVARIELPPLRKRTGDIGLLARHFWRVFGGIDSPPDQFIQRLESYDWPGNVRELHNAVVRRLSLGELDRVDVVGEMSGARSLDPKQTTDTIERILASELPFPRARDEVVSDFERRYVERVLARYDGNVTRAAAASGIALRYFQVIRSRQTNPPKE
jgi:transcriptional regulator with GAF, ATPase, and Fis domain